MDQHTRNNLLDFLWIDFRDDCHECGLDLFYKLIYYSFYELIHSD